MSSTTATTKVQSIVTAVSQDIRSQLAASGNDSNILVDYTNRVHLEMLRASRWYFLLSPVQRFVTQLGVTDYWIGASGGAANGQYDTGLNLTDIRLIRQGQVFDRSNFHILKRVDEGPIFSKVAYPDDTSRPGKPAVFKYNLTEPGLMSIFPAPDNQNTFRPQPEPPIVKTVGGGSLPARVYYVTVTYVDSLGGESTAPKPTAKIYVPANNLLVVYPPQEPVLQGSAGIQYNRYNVYASTIQGSEILQNGGTPVSTSSTWTEPTSGLVSNTSLPPTNNSVEPIDGYIIEFRYYQTRTQLTQLTQILQIPDDYKDIVIAGVNAYSYQFLQKPQDAQLWFGMFRDGISQIIRDTNLYMRNSSEYLAPDGASIGQRLPAVESIDLSVLSS